MTNNVIFYIYDGSDAGRDYKAGDIVDIQDGWIQSPATGLWRLRCPALPPAAPFLLARVWGVTKAESQFLMDVDYNGISMRTKRLWQLRTQSVPASIRNFFNAHRWVGFGVDGTLQADDITATEEAYGTLNDGDSVLQWTTARTWLVNKQTGGNASNRQG